MGKDCNLKLINFGFSIDNIFFTPINLIKCKPSERTAPFSHSGPKVPNKGKTIRQFHSEAQSYSVCSLLPHTRHLQVLKVLFYSPAPIFPSFNPWSVLYDNADVRARR